MLEIIDMVTGDFVPYSVGDFSGGRIPGEFCYWGSNGYWRFLFLCRLASDLST